MHVLFSVVGLFAVLLHIGVYGYYGNRLIGYIPTTLAARLATWSSLGMTILGFQVLALGHLHGLTPLACIVSSLIVLTISLLQTRKVVRIAKQIASAVLVLFRSQPVLACSCGTMLVIVFYSGLRPAQMTDELEYHWAAPQLWANAGQWVASPFRLTNGPCLAEIIYTIGAIFSNVTIAHWTHSLFLLILILACGALTIPCGGRAIVAAASCLSVPVIVNQSSVAYNDLAAAALAVSAYVPVLCYKKEHWPQSLKASCLLAGVLLAGAVSVKPFTIVALPGLIVCAYCSTHGTASQNDQHIKLYMALTARLCLPVIVAMALWFLHTYSLIGCVWDSNGQHLVHSASDPMWLSGAAAGRIPSVKDILTLPFVPAITSILGQREPYGGRTGLLLLFFFPAGLLAAHKLPIAQRNRIYWIIASAAAYFMLLGPIAIKTRFHIFIWALASCVASAGLNILVVGSKPNVSSRVFLCYCLLMWIGMVDAAHVLLREVKPVSNINYEMYIQKKHSHTW